MYNEKKSEIVNPNTHVNESRNNSGKKSTLNNPEFARFAKKVKRIVQELISINEPNHFQHQNITLPPIKQVQHRTISHYKQAKPKTRSSDEHNRNKRIKPAATPEPVNDPEVPKDILERSFKNPNFFSSHLLKRQLNSIEVESHYQIVERYQEKINSSARLTFADISEVPRQHEGLTVHTNPKSGEAGQNYPAKRDNSIDKTVKNYGQRNH